ncbi:MAG: helix-turn-helix domain-containing protein [Oscillospiraceae bacterium]|nr:helix-turn-helix domain-containing protein [Oscillospiraceae bacterium]
MKMIQFRELRKKHGLSQADMAKILSLKDKSTISKWETGSSMPRATTWDYSALPLNILGQVSLLYSFLWIPISALGIFIDDRLRYRLFGEDKPRYTLL